MPENDEPRRQYQPIEPSHGGQDLVRNGAKAGARLHSLLNLVALVAVLTGVASRALEGTPYRSPVLVTAIAFLVALAVIYFQRRAQGQRDEP